MDPVWLGDLPEDLLISMAETAYDPDREMLQVILLQSPLDEIPEVALRQVVDIFRGIITGHYPRSERS